MNTRTRINAVLVALVPLLLAAPGRAHGIVAPPPVSAVAVVTAQSEPAVEVPDTEEEDAEQPWTVRYMVPTLMVLGVGGIVLSIVVYASRVLSRYRVVR